MERLTVLLLSICLAIVGVAQVTDGRLAQRHAQIDSTYRAERYAELIHLVDRQVLESMGTTWQDSIHRYLYKYGRAHRVLHGADASTQAAERLLTQVQQRGNAANLLEALFDLSWIYYDVGLIKQCIRVDSTAMVVVDADPNAPLSQRGRTRQYLAFDHSIKGDHRKSAAYALEALDIYATADSIPPVQWAESLTAVGVAYWRMGRMRDAGTYYEKALERLAAATDDAGTARRASIYGNLGVMWQSAGDLPRSKMFYRKSMAICDRIIATTADQFTRDEMIMARARGYLNLATVYFELGDDGKARELLELSYADRATVLQPDDPQLLSVKDRMADLALNAGDFARAEELATTYLLACEQRFGTSSSEYVRSLSKLGEIARQMGDLPRADSLYKMSLDAGAPSMDEGTDIETLLTLQGRAQVYLATQRFTDALSDLQRARAIRVRIHGPLHHKVALADVLLAEAAFLKGDLQGALAYSNSALGLLQDRVRALEGSNVPLSFPEPHLLPDAIHWNVRAKHALANGVVDPTWSKELDIAIATLERNKTWISDDASKLQLIGAQERLFDLALDLTYEAFANTGSEKDLEHFLALSEVDRSILLKSRLNAFAGLRFAEVPTKVVDREAELLRALEIDPDDPSTIVDLEGKEEEYRDFLIELEREHPRYYALRYGQPAVSLADIRRKLLGPDRRLLSYALTERYLYMVVVGMDNTALIRSDARGLSGLVTALNAAIAARDDSLFADRSHAVYQRVFAPVQHLLNGQELLIIPDGPLHTVNFEVLLAVPKKHGQRAEMLVQRYGMAYLLSATTAIQFAGMTHDRDQGLLAIAPGFTDELKQDYLAQLADSTLLDRDFLQYIRQPFAVKTANWLGQRWSAKVMVGMAANETTFREQAQRYGILHLGTHAEMNATSPMYSRLVLSKDGVAVDGEADGYLHAYEIYELDLRAQLAVLTACETGAGKDQDGEGVRSLGHSFAYAGCPSLVMSLWKIDEKVSSEIIGRFYEYLAEGMPKHMALRQAKLDHLANASEELSAPYYWAGMVLVGDVSPLEVGSFWGQYRWWIYAFVTLVLVVLAIRWKSARRTKG